LLDEELDEESSVEFTGFALQSEKYFLYSLISAGTLPGIYASKLAETLFIEVSNGEALLSFNEMNSF